LTGIIYQSTGMWYTAKLESGKFIECRLKGKLRLKESDTTNPVAVGDKVHIALENGDYLITEVQKRDNYIIRSSPRYPRKNHILASNVDQSLLIVSLSYLPYLY